MKEFTAKLALVPIPPPGPLHVVSVWVGGCLYHATGCIAYEKERFELNLFGVTISRHSVPPNDMGLVLQTRVGTDSTACSYCLRIQALGRIALLS